MSDIETLEQVAEVLEENGYEPVASEGAVSVGVGGQEAPFAATLTINKERQELSITCQLAVLGDVLDDRELEFTVACLDANTRVRPYAFAVITASDNPELDDPDEWPVVLTDSLPLGDLSPAELISSMDSLWAALAASWDVLHTGMDANE